MNPSFAAVFIATYCLMLTRVTWGQRRQSPFNRFGARLQGDSSRGRHQNLSPIPVPKDYDSLEPFDFAYASNDDEGSHSHNQHGDTNGRVNGEYEIQLEDGRSRVVRYYADNSGFYADVVTNELGTESQDPADVTIRSSAPTGPEAAVATRRSSRPRRPHFQGGFRQNHRRFP
ncbi:uncharacterized protein LOC111247555 [Varroa destructor]|uniref:Uncharacterized protein n=1 Tax=Varroa destructor TaxID=109461 RepID=A0A7M7JXZ0_VARDE|nr:uncharacterized protein LOC111247555 [Varroa destructor]